MDYNSNFVKDLTLHGGGGRTKFSCQYPLFNSVWLPRPSATGKGHRWSLYKGLCGVGEEVIQSSLFPLQEGKAEQLHIKREGKQIAHMDQNKLLLGEGKQLEPVQPDMETMDLKTSGCREAAFRRQDLLSNAQGSPLLTSAYVHKWEPTRKLCQM